MRVGEYRAFADFLDEYVKRANEENGREVSNGR